MISLTGFLSKQTAFFIEGLAVALTLIIGVVDVWTGLDLRVSVFFILPIVMVTWYVNVRTGALIAFFTTLVWYWVDLILGVSYEAGHAPYLNLGLRYLSFVMLVVFLQKLKSAFETQKNLSRRDSLTGILNRQAFQNVAELEIERSRRHRHPFTVGYIDLDNFKTVNDRYGHKKGDHLLKTVSIALKNGIRAIDSVARLGGDEFVLLLPETGAGPSEILFRRLKEKLTAEMQAHHYPVTFSIGVATFLVAPPTVEEMISKADETMYLAKNSGKDHIRQQVFAGG